MTPTKNIDRSNSLWDPDTVDMIWSVRFDIGVSRKILKVRDESGDPQDRASL
jgi:hypothetical protein